MGGILDEWKRQLEKEMFLKEFRYNLDIVKIVFASFS